MKPMKLIKLKSLLIILNIAKIHKYILILHPLQRKAGV